MEDCDTLIRLDPRNAAAYYTRGTAYEKLGQLDRCVDDLGECLRLDPGHYNAEYALGACENKRGNYYKAIEDYNLAFEKEKLASSPPRKLDIDRLQYLLGSPDIKRSLSRPASSSTFYGSAKPEHALDMADFATRSSGGTLSRVSSRGLLSPDLRRGSSSGKLALRSDEARDPDTGKSHASSSTGPSPKKLVVDILGEKNEAERIHTLGYEAKKRGDYAAAVSLYTKAIEADPGYLKAYFNRGFAHDKAGEYEKAIADYTRVVEMDTHNAYAFYNRGIALDKVRRFAEAIQDFSQAIALHPDRADFYHNRGFAYRKRRDFAKAVQDYSEAIRLDPRHFKVRLSWLIVPGVL